MINKLTKMYNDIIKILAGTTLIVPWYFQKKHGTHKRNKKISVICLFGYLLFFYLM